jgi:hypothetical protein
VPLEHLIPAWGMWEDVNLIQVCKLLTKRKKKKKETQKNAQNINFYVGSI